MDSKNFVVYIKNLLESNNIVYWLDTGNLLEYRRGDILRHNEVDCDFGVFLKDFYTILELCKNDSRISFKAIWHGEIAIYDKENPKFHIDFFCYSEADNFLFLHDYVMNKFSGRHDLERNARYLKSEIFPLQKITYYNSTFNAPKNIDAHLYRRYGDWKIPNPTWTWNDAENVCKDYRQFAIVVDQKNVDVLEWIINKLPKEMYNLYFDKTYTNTIEPFILHLKTIPCKITDMWQVLVCDATIRIVIDHPIHLTCNKQTLKTKCQNSVFYEDTNTVDNTSNVMIRRNKLSEHIARINR